MYTHKNKHNVVCKSKFLVNTIQFIFIQIVKFQQFMYVKTPKQQVKDRKEHYKSDGMSYLLNNSGTDLNFLQITVYLKT